MTPSQRSILALAVGCTVLAVSCGQSEPALDVAPDPSGATAIQVDPGAAAEWGTEAVIWTEALQTLPGESGGAAWRYFWDPEIEFDSRSIWPGAEIEEGEAAFSFMRRLLPPRAQASTPAGTAFVSTEGVISMVRLDWGPSGMDFTTITATPAHIVDVLGPIGTQGAQRMVSAFAADSWRERRVSSLVPDEVDAFAARWTAAWSGRGGDVEDLYASDAELVDSISGLSIRGDDDIADVAEAQEPAAWAVTELGDGTATVYPITFDAGTLDGLVLIVAGADRSACRRQLAVLLDVADGQVVREERFWPIEDARRCLPTADLPAGWWDELRLEIDDPRLVPEDLVTQTGIVQVDGVRTVVYNGSPHLQAAIRWGLTRFEIAGLPFPAPIEITFTTYSELCDEATGRGRLHDGEWRLYLCFDEDDLCADPYCSTYSIGPTHTLLHEFAHVWLRDNLSDGDRLAFTEFVGLTVWSADDVAWADQAMEHAAEALAWGLCDGPFRSWQLADVDDDQMRSRFEFLTGRTPLHPAGID